MKIVSVYKVNYQTNNPQYRVDLSIGYNANLHGYFTAENDSRFRFRNITMLTEEQANSVAGLANACYEMGYRQAKHDIARKLGLLDTL